MLHRGALGQGEIVDERGGPAREGARRGGAAPAPAAPVVRALGRGVDDPVGHAIGLPALLGLGGRRRAHVFVGHVEQACVLAAPRRHGHSHSMVPGGFDVTSSATRFTPSTSLMMREAIRSTRS